MAAKLTDELRSELAAHPGEPIRIIGDTGETFYLISESRLAALETAAHQESDASLKRLRALIKEGDKSPEVDGESVHAELLEKAKRLDAASA